MMDSLELLTDVLDILPAMEFTGPVTPGGPDVILYGTAEQIYEQIIEVNPKYDVWDFPEYAADLESQGITRENIDSPLRFSMNPYYTAKETLENRASVRQYLVPSRYAKPLPYLVISTDSRR
jgi:hypothetical protein